MSSASLWVGSQPSSSMRSAGEKKPPSSLPTSCCRRWAWASGRALSSASAGGEEGGDSSRTGGWHLAPTPGDLSLAPRSPRPWIAASVFCGGLGSWGPSARGCGPAAGGHGGCRGSRPASRVARCVRQQLHPPLTHSQTPACAPTCQSGVAQRGQQADWVAQGAAHEPGMRLVLLELQQVGGWVGGWVWGGGRGMGLVQDAGSTRTAATHKTRQRGPDSEPLPHPTPALIHTHTTQIPPPDSGTDGAALSAVPPPPHCQQHPQPACRTHAPWQV